jgi:NitT/TauT family transport system substrate-binding protein
MVAIAMVGAACAPAASTAPTPDGATPAPTTASTAVANPSQPTSAADLVIPKPAGELTFAFGHSAVDINDMPTKITIDRLNTQGWSIDLPEFSAIDLLNQALAQGTVKMTNGSLVDPLRAFQAGGPVAWAMENNQGEYVFITKNEYPDCKALDGKIYGMHGETSSSSLAGRRWLEQTCGVTPQIVIIPGGDNRIVALINGQLDATVVQLFDWLSLREQSADFKVLDTGDLFSTISGSAFWINTEWVAANEDVAVAFLAEQLKTFRMIREDPKLIEDAIAQELPDYPVDQIAATVDQYITQIGAWPVNGGDTEMVGDAITFFTEQGELQPGLQVSQVANASLLEQALAIVGRVPDAR